MTKLKGLSSQVADPQPSCLQVQVAAEQIRLANTRVQPDCALALEANQISQQHMSTASSLADILRRPHIHYRFVALSLCVATILL